MVWLRVSISWCDRATILLPEASMMKKTIKPMKKVAVAAEVSGIL
jgi:hypothetical protein